jgi:RNA polymerase sigma-70 factor (ECF subfamily)
MTEHALTRRLLAGEESAFEEFFAEYFPRLLRFASARVNGDDDLAEEAVQATLIRALKNIDAFRGDAPLFSWLCTICRREIARRRTRTGTHVDIELLDDVADRRAHLDALDRAELAALVRSILGDLPEHYGRALEWRYIEGLTVHEIADRLGLGYKAAESLLSRAREAFRHSFHAARPEET